VHQLTGIRKKGVLFFLCLKGSRVGHGWASASNPTFRRGLFERSEFPSHLDSGQWTRHPQGRAQAKMLLSPFGETKGLRRAGTKARINNPYPNSHPHKPERTRPLHTKDNLDRKSTGYILCVFCYNEGYGRKGCQKSSAEPIFDSGRPVLLVRKSSRGTSCGY